MQHTQGFLLVDKPASWTSFDVVNYVRKIVAAHDGTKPKHTKVGHCGTLDPMATGLLLLVIGKEYTRRAAEFTKKDKVYEFEMTLGSTSSTGDAEGELSAVSEGQPELSAVEAALKAFEGDIMQTPPAFSAMKINGQRAYKLAREGKPVELSARPVHIFSNAFKNYTYPLVHFDSHVSSGTYIRSLVEDIGTQLETGAYMTGLRRTRIGDFSINDAVKVEGLTAEIITGQLRTD